MNKNEKTSISVYMVDCAEWRKFCKLAKVHSPDAFHELLVYAMSGDLVAIIKPKNP